MKNLILLIALGITTTFTAKAAEDDAFVEFRVLKPEIAIKAAVSAMNFCRDGGYQVGVTVVDRFGLTQVFVKSRYAGLHVQETATRKAGPLLVSELQHYLLMKAHNRVKKHLVSDLFLYPYH